MVDGFINGCFTNFADRLVAHEVVWTLLVQFIAFIMPWHLNLVYKDPWETNFNVIITDKAVNVSRFACVRNVHALLWVILWHEALVGWGVFKTQTSIGNCCELVRQIFLSPSLWLVGVKIFLLGSDFLFFSLWAFLGWSWWQVKELYVMSCL